MKNTTSLAIKANIASWFASALIIIIPALIVPGARDAMMSNKFISGIFSIVVAFASLWISLKMLLKNAKLTLADKEIVLQRTWHAYLIITAGLLFFDFQGLVAKFGFAYQIVLLILQATSAYLAIWTVKKSLGKAEDPINTATTDANKKKHNFLFYVIVSAFILLFSIFLIVGRVKQKISTQNKSQNNISNQPKITVNDNKEKMQSSKILASGDFGPYAYDKINGVLVAISNKIRAIAYYEGGKGYVIVNDKKFGPYDGVIKDLKVSDNFWGFIFYKGDGASMATSKKIVVISGNQTELDNKSDNIYFAFSDTKNAWGIRYDGMGRRVFIVNNKPSTEAEYYELTKIISYQNKDNADYYVKVDNNEYLVGSGSDEGALFAQCMVYNQNKWGCSVGKKDGTWHIFVYENGIKKEYGPYGKFSDPREESEFKLSNDGFIFCSSNLAVVNKDGFEKTFHGQGIYQCNYAEGNFGFIHASNKNNGLVNVNGKEYGPYALIDNFSLTNGGWGFRGYISKIDKSEYIINGITISDINSITGPAVSNDYWAVGYEKDKKLYMRVEKNKNKIYPNNNKG